MVKKSFKAKIPFSVSIKGADSVEYKKGATIAEEHLPMCHSSLIEEIKEAKKAVENKTSNVDKEAEEKAKALEEAKKAVENKTSNVDKEAEEKAKALEEAKKAVENAEKALEETKNANDKKSAQKVLDDAKASLAELEK